MNLTGTVRSIGIQAWKTARRFPLALASSFVVTGLVLYLTVDWEHKPADILFPILLTAMLGISFFFALKLLLERLSLPRLRAGLVRSGGLLALGLFYWSLPDPDLGRFYYYFAQVFLASHLFVAFAPYISADELSGFWQFNRRLFVRFWLSVLFTMTFYFGLSISLGTIDYLFPIEVGPKMYTRVFILLVGIFNTWFFLGGVPENWAKLKADPDNWSKISGGDFYPWRLRLFTQYVLMPLLLIYGTILFVYTITLVMSLSLPVSFVGYLVGAYGVAGMLGLLLVYPLRWEKKETWSRWFWDGFFAGMIPLVLLLLIALVRRIYNYGLTENRYLLFVLCFWIVGMTVYFLGFRGRNIKWVPITLCGLMVVGSFGPWSSYELSEFTQLQRLEYYFNQAEVLRDGTLHPVQDTIDDNSHREIHSIVNYLSRHHSLRGIKPWLSEKIKKQLSAPVSEIHAHGLLLTLNIECPACGDQDFHLTGNDNRALLTRGFYYSVSFYLDADEMPRMERRNYPDVGDVEHTFEFTEDQGTLIIKTDRWDNFEVPLTQLANEIESQSVRGDNYSDTLESSIEASNDQARVRIVFNKVSGEKLPNRINYSTLEFTLMIDPRE